MVRLSRLLKDYGETGAINSLIALWGFVDETTFLTKSGHVGVVYRVHGIDAEGLTHAQRLTAIRQQGHWEQWLIFFLRGVSSTALAATQTARDIVALRDTHRATVARNAKALTLLDHLFRQPTVSVNRVAKVMACTFPTASRLVAEFESLGWLKEMTGNERNRLWCYQPYLELFHREALDATVAL